MLLLLLLMLLLLRDLVGELCEESSEASFLLGRFDGLVVRLLKPRSQVGK